jgi:uncharacterized membrane protein YgcG
MTVIVIAAALVTTLLASSLPAGAQTGEEPCPEGTIKSEPLDPGGPLEGKFVCVGENASLSCPEGFVEVPAELLLFQLDREFVCEPEPGDGGDGNGGGSDSSGGGGGSDGGGGAGGGGAAAPITQEGDQGSEAGEIDQTFDVSHQS